VAGRVADVTFTNVPAWVSARGLLVPTSAGEVEVAVAFGGAFYASVRVTDVALQVRPEHLPRLVALSREIRSFFAADDGARAAVTHPGDERLDGLYGTIWVEDAGSTHDPARLHQRNVTVFADGEVDRSPCGSGTSARLALLHDEGAVGPDTVLWHDGIVGSRFCAWIVGTPAGGVVTAIRGSAHRTGHHAFVLDPGDPIGEGFVLR
jgi:proline racemase